MIKGSLRITGLLIALAFTGNCFSQSVAINNSGTAPDSTAILDVSSDTKGLLVPRMTALQKNAIVNPATGLLIYQTDGESGFYYYNGLNWFLLITTAATDKQNTLIYTVKGF